MQRFSLNNHWLVKETISSFRAEKNDLEKNDNIASVGKP